VATTNVEVVNLTEFTGFFGKAYESHVFNQHIQFQGVMSTIDIVLLFFAVVIVIFIIVLAFYEDQLTQDVLGEASLDA
jgi:hypothetical protein